MDIQAIGNQTFSVYISEDELTSHHIRPEAVTCEQALELLSPAFGRSGLDNARLSLFPGNRELLIFVRRTSKYVEYFKFHSFEDLLSAILGDISDMPSSVYYYDDSYILVLRRWDENATDSLLEFGEKLYASPDYVLHLREHGQTITEGFATAELRRAFAQQEKCGK